MTATPHRAVISNEIIVDKLRLLGLVDVPW